MGIIDRVLRIVVGPALIAAALGLHGPAYQSVGLGLERHRADHNRADRLCPPPLYRAGHQDL
ncbi:MAG TPA: hypothetical protein VG758_02910 [Hyphomicrobiaceae bacterium]|nr:hypothetical protein [Hyphomicrobiaceae bacterium]